jgi:hypothetical protein
MQRPTIRESGLSFGGEVSRIFWSGLFLLGAERTPRTERGDDECTQPEHDHALTLVKQMRSYHDFLHWNVPHQQPEAVVRSNSKVFRVFKLHPYIR